MDPLALEEVGATVTGATTAAAAEEEEEVEEEGVPAEGAPTGGRDGVPELAETLVAVEQAEAGRDWYLSTELGIMARAEVRSTWMYWERGESGKGVR